MNLHLENWFYGLAFFLAIAVFLYSVYDLTRRLLARFALRMCRMREAREGGFICNLKHKLHGVATKSLIPRVLIMIASIAVAAFIVIEHSSKL